MVDFSNATGGNQVLCLRQQIIDAVRIVVPARSKEDVFWYAVGVAGLMYGPHVLRPGTLGQDDSAALATLGIAAVAGTVPELATDLGYDSNLLVHHGYLQIRPWRQVDLSQYSREQLQQVGQIHKEMYAVAAPEMGRAIASLDTWHEKCQASERQNLRYTRQGEWIFNWLAKCITNLTPPMAARRSIAAEARSRGRKDLCSHPADADDVFAAYQALDWLTTKTARTMAIRLGLDGRWGLDAGAILDAAELGPGRKRAKEICTSDLVDSEETAQTFALIATESDDPSVLAEHRELVERVRSILLGAASDDLDRCDVELILAGTTSRSERARELRRGESTLRKREARIATKALRAASHDIRPIIKALFAV